MKVLKTGKAWALLLALMVAIALLVNPVVAKADAGFSDVKPSDWFYSYVMNMYKRDIVGGFSGTGEFRPRNQVTREHASKMIAGAAGLDIAGQTTSFKDNPAINPSLIPYIGALVDKGAITGFPDNTFKPRSNILRSHVCKIVVQAFDLENGDLPHDLTDLPSSQSLREAIITLASNGIVSGYGSTGEFRPNNEITRAELSKILCVTMAVSAVQKAEAAMTWEAIWEAQDILDDLPYHHIPDTVDDLQDRLNDLYEGLTGTDYWFRFRNADLESAAPYYLVGTSRIKHIRFESGDLYNVQVEVWRGDQQFEILPDPELGNHRYASEWIELEEGYNVFKVVFTDENGETCYRVRIEQELNSDLGFSNIILFGDAGYRKVLTHEVFYGGQAECEVFDDRAVLEIGEEWGVDVQAKLNNLPLTASRRRSISDGRWMMYVWDLIDLQMGVNRLDLTLTSSDGSASQDLTVLITRVNPANFVYSQTDIDAVNTLIAANPGWYMDIWESGSEPPSNWSWQVEWAGENPRRLVGLDCSSMSANQVDFSSLTALKELDVSGIGGKPDSIKLDGLVNLRSLSIGCNLKSLDLAGLFSMQRLTLSNTQFESLDLSDQPLLTHLQLEQTGLTSLDLSGQLLLEFLYCGYNQLGQLDLSGKNRLLELHCINNQLVSLDLTGATKLIFVDCSDNELVTLSIGNMPSLLGLACGSNQLTELDLRKAKNLLYLDCRDNELTKIHLHANSAPWYLDVTYNRLAGYSSVIGPSIDWDNPESGYEYYFAPQK